MDRISHLFVDDKKKLYNCCKTEKNLVYSEYSAVEVPTKYYYLVLKEHIDFVLLSPHYFKKLKVLIKFTLNLIYTIFTVKKRNIIHKKNSEKRYRCLLLYKCYLKKKKKIFNLT